MFRIIIVSSLLLFVTACSHEAPPEDVDKAGVLFFQRLNEADYDAIYKDAASLFKKNRSHDTTVDMLKDITGRGKAQDVERLSIAFGEKDNYRTATPVYVARFDQSKGEITLIFVDEGGEWKLISFAFKQRS